jgi:hypothetical protein
MRKEKMVIDMDWLYILAIFAGLGFATYWIYNFVDMGDGG